MGPGGEMNAGSRSTIVSCTHCGGRNRVRLQAPAAPRCRACARPLPWLVDADQASFRAAAELSPLAVLVNFWAPWCAPCRIIEPVVQQLSRELAGRLKVVRVNSDLAPELGERFNVRGVPTLILFEGGRRCDRLTGAPNVAALRSWLEGHLATRRVTRAKPEFADADRSRPRGTDQG
jgi:thioredoxin 2